MQQSTNKAAQIEAEMPFSIGHVKLVRNCWDAPIDRVAISDAHHLELALLPRPGESQGCFPDYWGPHRFERIGDVFLMPARQAVHAKSSCRQQHSIVFTFHPDAAQTWFDDDMKWTDSRLQAVLDIANPGIRNALFRLGEEIRNPGFASSAMVEMMAGQITIELARYCIGVEENKATGGLAPWKLRLIDERLAEQSSPPTLMELAALCGLSVRHLTRSFRISRCRSIGSYITECRINEAKRLLLSGGCVKSIAYSMGFTSPSNFSTAFRRATGETPRQYRQRAGGAKLTH
jgi:AraC family transcriptional regulator